MKTISVLLAAFLFTGCATQVKQTAAISILPASVQGVSREKVAEARAHFSSALQMRGLLVTRNYKDADYIVYAYFAPVKGHPMVGELLELSRERNPMKNSPVELPPLWPAVKDGPPGFDSLP